MWDDWDKEWGDDCGVDSRYQVGVTFKQLEVKLAACEADLRKANKEKNHNAGKFEGAVRECRKYKKQILKAKLLEGYQAERVSKLIDANAAIISQYNKQLLALKDHNLVRGVDKSLIRKYIMDNERLVDRNRALTAANKGHCRMINDLRASVNHEKELLASADAVHRANNKMKTRIAELECLLIQAVIDKNTEQPVSADKCRRDSAMALTACTALQSALRWFCSSFVIVIVMAMYCYIAG